MTIKGNWFSAMPENQEDVRALWKLAMRLTTEDLPEWWEGQAKDLRYFVATSWAYIQYEDQQGYFEDLHYMSTVENVALDYDMGDGCVTHIYIINPND